MKGWLDKYNDGGPVQENYNDYSVSAPEGYVGVGTFNEGRNYSPAWGGQFQDGGKLSFIDNPKLRNMLEGYKPGFLETVGDYRLPEGQIIPLRDPSTEVSISVGGGDDEPAYLIPSFKYGEPLQDPVQEFNMTEQYLGGPFKTVNDAETFRELRHQYVGKGQPLPSPIATANMAMGGSIGGATQGIPGATGFMYARTGTTPSEDKGRNKIYKTDASAQTGTKIEEDKAPISLIGKDFEKWIRNAGDDGISTYFSDLYNKRKASGEKITEEDYKGVKQQMLEYINSPLYAERQANLPDDYGLSKEDRKSPDAEKFLKQFNQETNDWKKKKRIELLNEVGIKLAEPKERTGHYVGSQLPSNIELSTPYTRAVIPHELGHAMHDFKAPLTDEQKAYMKENKGELPRDKQLGYRPAASDSSNAYNFYKYAKEEKGSGAQFANPKLNLAEANMFQRLAKPISLTSDKTRYREEDSSNFINNSSSQMETRAFNKRVDEYKRKMQQHYAKDEHIDKDSSDKFEFADEMYGDMQGVRQLLLDSGITKSFGEELDEEKINKAILDKNVTDDPVFRRFYFRYGKDNIIKLNNTIAANNPQQGMPIAQNGMEMSYYQNGLDFKPKSISKNGSVIKDDMGQWAHPGEITEIGSNQITMQGVPYPVLGISDTGDTQMMYPNEEYEFIGDSVTEYPMMKQGGQLTKLDQLLNFTNYNTKQPGGWLDKYQ